MKVNMDLLSDVKETELQTAPAKEQDVKEAPETEEAEGTEADTDEDEEDEIDNSDKHSKLKTFILVAAMIGGFGLFVWNMTGLANNMRLDNQGSAVNIVYEMEDLGSFMDGSGGNYSSVVKDDGQTESGVSTDAARDGPESADYADESEEMAALRQEAQDARNEAALVKQELKNAEDMLDSSLQREAELQSQLDEMAGRS